MASALGARIGGLPSDVPDGGDLNVYHILGPVHAGDVIGDLPKEAPPSWTPPLPTPFVNEEFRCGLAASSRFRLGPGAARCLLVGDVGLERQPRRMRGRIKAGESVQKV